MERDFLGLNSSYKDPLLAVKREISEQETQWPFTEKASSFSRFMSLKTGSGQDGGMNKMNYSPPAKNPFAKPDFAISGHTTVGPITGFTESWNNSKPVTAPAQMTIFYGGSVSVFDGISPEKAQAIMLLAGNGSFLASSNTSHPSHKVQSHTNLQSVGLSSSKDGQVVTNTVAASCEPVSMPNMVPSALPQFRKASLARFLEKRKERVMSIGPYTCEKKQEGIYAAKNNIGSRASSLAM